MYLNVNKMASLVGMIALVASAKPDIIFYNSEPSEMAVYKQEQPPWDTRPFYLPWIQPASLGS
jgi:hypothetical protein